MTLTVTSNLLSSSLEFRHIAVNCSKLTYVASIELLCILDEPQIASFQFTACNYRRLLGVSQLCDVLNILLLLKPSRAFNIPFRGRFGSKY